jgi:hypothetical protein
MNKGIKTLIYPVKDIAQARDLYGKLLGVKPYMDEAYYVGFRVGDQEIGLDPHAPSQGITVPVAYYPEKPADPCRGWCTDRTGAKGCRLRKTDRDCNRCRWQPDWIDSIACKIVNIAFP